MKFPSVFKYVLLGILIYFPLFGALDRLPIRIWDEARLAQNAWEMRENGNLLVTYAFGKPDMWNTKPPLMIWIQVVFIKLLGYNEIAIRLPSTLAAFFTCLLLVFLSERYLKSGWFGIISVMVLVCMQGYISIHGTRTGDYDAMLTLFTTAYCLAFFAFLESSARKYLYLFFLCLLLAVLTKGIGGLLMLPGLFFYALLRKKIISLLKEKHFYIGLGLFLFISVGYYLLREHYNPGYLLAVWNNELGGRYLRTSENHEHPFLYFYNNLIHDSAGFWLLPMIAGFFTGIASADKKINRISAFAGLVLLSFFLVISFSETKLSWYDLPMYPFMAVLTAVLICTIFNRLRESVQRWGHSGLKQKKLSRLLPYIFLLLVFAGPYAAVWDKTQNSRENYWDAEQFNTSHFLKDAGDGKHDINNYFIALSGLSPHVQFYLYKLQEKGITVDFKDLEKLQLNDRIIAAQPEMQEYIRGHYFISETPMEYNVIVFEILGKIPEK